MHKRKALLRRGTTFEAIRMIERASFPAFLIVKSTICVRTKRLLASGVRARARARMKILNCSRRKETLRGGAAGWRGRSRVVCGGGAHVSVLGRWRREPVVSKRLRMLRAPLSHSLRGIGDTQFVV